MSDMKVKTRVNGVERETTIDEGAYNDIKDSVEAALLTRLKQEIKKLEAPFPPEDDKQDEYWYAVGKNEVVVDCLAILEKEGKE